MLAVVQAKSYIHTKHNCVLRYILSRCENRFLAWWALIIALARDFAQSSGRVWLHALSRVYHALLINPEILAVKRNAYTCPTLTAMQGGVESHYCCLCRPFRSPCQGDTSQLPDVPSWTVWGQQ